MTSSTKKNIALLLGAGSSIPAQMPSTWDITQQILSGQGIVRHTNGNYVFSPPQYGGFFPDEYVPRVLRFLEKIKLEIKHYYNSEPYYSSEPYRFVNYEDIYFVTSQIEDSQSGEYDNPIVQPFIEKILSDIQSMLIGNENEIRQSWQLNEIAQEATNYIRDIVWHMLIKMPCRFDHLSCIKDACLDSNLSKVDIFTLNHDNIIEQYLEQNNIEIIDGFSEPINNVRYWNPDLFENEQKKVRLFKLHGSVNWFRFRPDGGDWSQESIGISLLPDIWHTRDNYGQRQMPVDGRPIFLAGTFNKMLQYTSGIYADLHYRYYRSLRHIERLIICGYSFGDKGINSRIIEWIYSSGNKKITIIHPNPDDLKQKARGAIRNKWDNWICQKRLFIIPNRIEETSWQGINDILKQ